jgi:hypothetical protein
MLTHIVIWKYRADADAETRREHVSMLRRLPSLVPGISSFEVGFDVLGLPRSYDTGLVAVFADRAALDAYTVHPEHIAVADFGRTISEHVASVDFESDDYEARVDAPALPSLD